MIGQTSETTVVKQNLENEILHSVADINSQLVLSNNNSKAIFFACKRAFDVFAAIIGLIFSSPLWLIIAILIKKGSKGPVLFLHSRVGKNHKPLKIYKFRTMVQDAEELLKKFTPEQKAEFEKNFKLENDFRITKIGKFLRKTSLDELPQLINILKGDLSLVGPRPVVEKELLKYGENQDKFLSVTPGLTGYWQANGRSDTTYEERIEMELYYVDNCSFGLDIKIMFKTVYAVIRKQGAV